MVVGKCEECSKESEYSFKCRVKRFCSYGCSSKYKGRKKSEAAEKRCISCQVCKKAFSINESELRVRERDGAIVKYCSVDCSAKGRTRYDLRSPVECGHCKKNFLKLNSRLKTVNYCSKICVGNALRKPVLESVVENKKQPMIDWSDKQAVRQYNIAYRIKNGARLKEKREEWHSANGEKRTEIRRRWAANNKEKISAIARARRAGASPKDFTAEDWEKIKKTYGYRCLCCKRQEGEVALEADHVISLKLGGRHHPINIQPLCRNCNARKSTKHIDFRPPVVQIILGFSL